MCPIPPTWSSPPPLTPLPPLIAWPPLKKEMQRAALSHHMSLEQTIAEALERAESGGYKCPKLISALLSARDHANKLGEYFSEDFKQHPEIYNERKPEGSSIAARVFKIPELLETILEHLEILDVLSFYQCSVSIRDLIEASSKLQAQLSLRPASVDGHFKLPLKNLGGILINDLVDGDLFYVGFSNILRFGHLGYSGIMEPDNDEADRTVEIQAHFGIMPGQLLPRVGSRIRRMLITQPPLEKMTVALGCCSTFGGWQACESFGTPESSKSVRTVSRVGGLTIGALYDRAKELLDEHRFCPRAHSGLLNDDGTVRVGVRFVGKMVLHPDDPIYVKHRETEQIMKEDDRKWRRQSAKLEAFCKARRAAHANGDPIPLLEDFIASHGEDADWESLAYPPDDPLQSIAEFDCVGFSMSPQYPPPPPAISDWVFPPESDPLGVSGTFTAQADPASTPNTSIDTTVVPVLDVSSGESGSLVAVDVASTMDTGCAGASTLN